MIWAPLAERGNRLNDERKVTTNHLRPWTKKTGFMLLADDVQRASTAWTAVATVSTPTSTRPFLFHFLSRVTSVKRRTRISLYFSCSCMQLRCVVMYIAKCYATQTPRRVFLETCNSSCPGIPRAFSNTSLTPIKDSIPLARPLHGNCALWARRWRLGHRPMRSATSCAHRATIARSLLAQTK